jgi:hypothetical protein
MLVDRVGGSEAPNPLRQVLSGNSPEAIVSQDLCVAGRPEALMCTIRDAHQLVTSLGWSNSRL